MEYSPQPSIADVHRPRDQGKLEHAKSQGRKPHSRSARELRISRVNYNPAPDAQDRLRRLFTILLRYAAVEGVHVGGEDSSRQDPEQTESAALDAYHQCDDVSSVGDQRPLETRLGLAKESVEAFAHPTKTDDLGKRFANEGIRHKGSKRPQKRGGL